MLDLDTFLTIGYVKVDDFCKENLPTEGRPGPEASLSRSEVVTLAVLGQWARVASERDFRRLHAVTPEGLVTGLSFGPASAKDPPSPSPISGAGTNSHPALNCY